MARQSADTSSGNRNDAENYIKELEAQIQGSQNRRTEQWDADKSQYQYTAELLSQNDMLLSQIAQLREEFSKQESLLSQKIRELQNLTDLLQKDNS